MAGAKRTDPELWERVKAEVTAGDKGGGAGEWSARKAQMAVQQYKKRGGGYDDKTGPSKDETSLHKWTEEDWGTKSGNESGETGERYLPKTVRMLLTEDEYRCTTARKRRGREQFVDQPDDVREKVAAIQGKGGPSKEVLEERAAELGIIGREGMTKGRLLKAIEGATDRNGRAKAADGSLEAKSKADLLGMARERGVEGRSTMSKEELVRALGARVGA